MYFFLTVFTIYLFYYCVLLYCVFNSVVQISKHKNINICVDFEKERINAYLYYFKHISKFNSES